MFLHCTSVVDTSSTSATLCKQGHASVQVKHGLVCTMLHWCCWKMLDEFVLDSLGTCRRLVGLVSVWLLNCRGFKRDMPCVTTDLSCTYELESVYLSLSLLSLQAAQAKASHLHGGRWASPSSVLQGLPCSAVGQHVWHRALGPFRAAQVEGNCGTRHFLGLWPVCCNIWLSEDHTKMEGCMPYGHSSGLPP